jgi:hypothetical protein
MKIGAIEQPTAGGQKYCYKIFGNHLKTLGVSRLMLDEITITLLCKLVINPAY